MAFLSLNGVDVELTSVRRTTVRAGGSHGARGFSGALYGGPSRTRQEWQCTTVPLAQATAAALQGLVEGAGDAWHFQADGTPHPGPLRSAQGLEVLAQGTGPLQGLSGSAPGPWSDAVRVEGADGWLEWEVGKAAGWTCLAHALHPDASWKSLLWRSSAGRWSATRPGATTVVVRDDAMEVRFLTYDAATGRLRLKAPLHAEPTLRTWGPATAYAVGDLVAAGGVLYRCTTAGTSGGSAPTWGSVYGGTTADGTAVWTHRGNSYAHVAELVFLPYVVPDAWAPQLLSAFHTLGSDAGHAALPSLPSVRAEGDFWPTPTNEFVAWPRPPYVQGEVTGARLVAYQLDGTWTQGEEVSFTLREV